MTWTAGRTPTEEAIVAAIAKNQTVKDYLSIASAGVKG